MNNWIPEINCNSERQLKLNTSGTLITLFLIGGITVYLAVLLRYSIQGVGDMSIVEHGLAAYGIVLLLSALFGFFAWTPKPMPAHWTTFIYLLVPPAFYLDGCLNWELSQAVERGYFQFGQFTADALGCALAALTVKFTMKPELKEQVEINL